MAYDIGLNHKCRFSFVLHKNLISPRISVITHACSLFNYICLYIGLAYFIAITENLFYRSLAPTANTDINIIVYPFQTFKSCLNKFRRIYSYTSNLVFLGLYHI